MAAGQQRVGPGRVLHAAVTHPQQSAMRLSISCLAASLSQQPHGPFDSNCILEPGGVTILNRIALIHPAQRLADVCRDGSNPIYRSLCELADAQGQEAECNSNLSQTCIWYVPSPPPPPVPVHRLYFYTVDNTMAPSFVRCGEVDAARHSESTRVGPCCVLFPNEALFLLRQFGPMCDVCSAVFHCAVSWAVPPSLFEPANELALAAYTEAATRLYTNHFAGITPGDLKVGRCKGNGFTQHGGTEMGMDFAPDSLMGPTCLAECGCQWSDYTPARHLPACTKSKAVSKHRSLAMPPTSGAAAVCVNDDSTTSQDGHSTCSSWYDANPQGCGHYDDRDFTASVQCCACGGGGRGQTAKEASDTPGSPYETPAAATDPDFLQQVTDAVVADARGNHHLWFYALDTNPPVHGVPSTVDRCGEVDAAPYMPAALFEPQNSLQLAAYVAATVDLYRVPVLDKPVMFGRCAQKTEFTNCNGGRVGGVGWNPSSIMRPICQERCNCTFNSRDLVIGCPDVADDPANGNFCSLCGPSTACPGCSAGTVSIDLCFRGRAPPPPPPPPSPAPAPPISSQWCSLCRSPCIGCPSNTVSIDLWYKPGQAWSSLVKLSPATPKSSLAN